MTFDRSPRYFTGLFDLGRTVATRGVLPYLETGVIDAGQLVARHQRGDWGDLDQDDKRANEHAVMDAERILSSYVITKDLTVWVITEADRSATTILLERV